jgi:hypothetical protein
MGRSLSLPEMATGLRFEKPCHTRDVTLTKKIMMKKITVTLTPAQMREVLEAISQMTDGNAYDYDEMKKCGVTSPHALVRAEQALRAAWENA